MKFLVKEFRKKHKKEGYTNYTPLLNDENYLDKIRKKCKNELEDRVTEYIMDMLSTNNVTNLQVFHELIEKGKIPRIRIFKSIIHLKILNRQLLIMKKIIMKIIFMNIRKYIKMIGGI